MNRKKFVLLLLVCVIPFLGYFLNPPLAYFDSYAFMITACGFDNAFLLPISFCNFFLNKLILLGLYIISVFSLAYFGEKVYNKHGWKVGFYSATLTPLFFQEAMKFENDIFGWTIVFFAFAVFGLGYCNKQLWKKAVASIVAMGLCFYATLFWSASFLGALIVGLMFLPALVFAVPHLIATSSFLLRYATLSRGIGEEQLGAGLIPVAIMFFPLISKPRNTKFFLATWFAFIIGFIKIKYMIFAIPLLALNFLNFEERIGKKWSHWPNMTVACVGLACAFFFVGFFSSPNIEELNWVEDSIQLAQDENVEFYNDWKYGWWVSYKGKQTDFKASYPNPDYNNLNKPFIAISDKNLFEIDCEIHEVIRYRTTWKCY